MNSKTSDKLFEFEVPLDHQVRLIESILETGDPPTPLSKVNWVGHPPINIFGMPGYIFPDRDIRCSGRVIVKTGSMVSNPMAIEFNYRFSGTKLHLWQVQAWGEIEIYDVIKEIRLVLESI
ncbi:MAG TPA: hypothetical protein PKL54_10355 [Candidatus Hydrogenedentes bacterium]|nr:hypothetical protein [Candidatus Hydrogenedentota bacterium]HOC73208.1 hypothetical protein [Candidatus Hydrogenedentota bacterium]HOH50777.1 hypothetical protein [Candidatus Hydrogenedentota bacterium]